MNAAIDYEHFNTKRILRSFSLLLPQDYFNCSALRNYPKCLTIKGVCRFSCYWTEIFCWCERAVCVCVCIYAHTRAFARGIQEQFTSAGKEGLRGKIKVFVVVFSIILRGWADRFEFVFEYKPTKHFNHQKCTFKFYTIKLKFCVVSGSKVSKYYQSKEKKFVFRNKN